MPENASSAGSGFSLSLSRITLAELRAAHGDESAIREALLRFFQRGFNAGLSINECMRLLFFEPSQAGSVIRRVGYADHQYEGLVRMVRELPVVDVLLQTGRAELGAAPHGGPTEASGDSDVGGGPPSVQLMRWAEKQ